MHCYVPKGKCVNPKKYTCSSLYAKRGGQETETTTTSRCTTVRNSGQPGQMIMTTLLTLGCHVSFAISLARLFWSPLRRALLHEYVHNVRRSFWRSARELGWIPNHYIIFMQYALVRFTFSGDAILLCCIVVFIGISLQMS